MPRWLAGAAGLAAGAYAAYVALAWRRYGHVRAASGDAADPLLDRFIPEYEIVERHHIAVAAPPEVTLAAARDLTLSQLPMVRAIFVGRSIIMGTGSGEPPSRGLLEEVRALGWVVLADTPGREIVFGAVTKPWEPDVVFRGLAPDAFRGFAEPGYVKIAWTLRADPAAGGASVFRTETRAVATDADARRKFRWYWACLSPGIIAIRWLMLRPVKAEAEARLWR